VKAPVRQSWSRLALRWLVFGLVCYVGVTVVLLALENRLVYRPCKAEENWFLPPFSPVENVKLQLADGTPIHGWWCPQDGADGALLYCHGNAGNLSHRGQTIRKMQQLLGVSVFIFDYPGYGRSGGSPTEQGCYQAANAAYEWLQKQVPSERILIYGSSLGGGVAIDLASRRPHRALVLDKTFTSMPDVAQRLCPWLPARLLMRNRFDSLTKIAKCRQPVFIGHGKADELIPFSQGERLFAAANEPKQFCPRETGGHNDPICGEFFASLKIFLAETEGSKALATGVKR
jgi:fermentation-respiration switch protein FrsA (DUF1100 family)